MYRFILAALASALLSVTFATTADASLTSKYNKLYAKVAKTHGKQTPGRHIVKDGYRGKHGVRPATKAEKARSIRTFRRWLAPPVPAATSTDRTPTAAVTTATHTGGRFSIPTYIVMCESGGNYRAQNPSGAGGAYQIMPGTWSAYGGSAAGPAGASPAEQDAVAARIYAAQGAAPWVCG